jgi:enoyl-CoA hydratase/carnithine racemase
MSTAASPSSDLSQLGSYTTLQLSWAAPAVLRVSLCNGKLNTMPRRFWSEMRECFQRIGANAEVRVVLLTAEGKIFSAGLDLAVSDWPSTGDSAAPAGTAFRCFESAARFSLLLLSHRCRITRRAFLLPSTWTWAVA